MFTTKRVPFYLVFPFARRSVLLFLAYSTVLCSLYSLAGWTFLAIPFVPVATIGTAVAFYVGFKSNSSYDRLWEARRIWGSLTNASRSWGIMVLDYLADRETSDPAHRTGLQTVHRELIYRHLAFLTALRVQLRQKPVWELHRDPAHEVVERIKEFRQCSLDKELSRFLPASEIEQLIRHPNPATVLMRQQSAQLRQLRDAGYLSDYYYVDMERMLVEFYTQQGGCERIKSFPFPRQYAFFSYVFVWLFIAVLPFGLLTEMAKTSAWHVWLTVPFFTVIAWVFNTMEIVGDTSENPFENSINDVPMTAICRNIEIDLRDMLGETELPKRVQSVNDILM
ncbi:bestrophin family protein [Spirosoma utsteinense]|uniref:Membrane protein n=1 Tax=Spirosoma utsteinense TaxID=2585773 RepID=A0ABR6W7A0_9BACT|nr:bestrophin family ion channel [Spirosoma utsteinense]MBC3785924.1 putative membrane protein [Spirosoma utsteinense]MBC3792094.1 putative membrane protein [Spirosoma utsteinense]